MDKTKVIVKVCGISNPEDALFCAQHGADWLGFVFAKSPRQVDAKTVAGIVRALVNAGLRENVRLTGVFVNENPAAIEAIAREAGLDQVQLHGDETIAEAEKLGLPWYKALRVKNRDELAAIREWPCAWLLVDAAVAGSYGGTGESVPDDLAELAVQEAEAAGTRLILAGGLAPENVRERLLRCRPHGVDVSSGVESSPGIKDHSRTEAFIRAAKDIATEH